MRLKPAAENTGIRFVRTDLPQKPIIKAAPESVYFHPSVSRCTSVGNEVVSIHTVEHLMSVLSGLGISNLEIEVNNMELPGLDGSGVEFLKAIKRVGLQEQNVPAACYEIKEPIGIEKNGSAIYILPSNELKISYTLNYDHPYLKSQFYSTRIDSQIFEQDIAPSRTFCLESEANELKTGGLGKGANYNNTLVVGERGVIENTLRFNDEFARHKVLDFLGDLYLLGMPIKGHVYAVKSGHYLNHQILKKICEQKKRYEEKGVVPHFDLKGTREIGIEEIMKILPHRYPFLLVDRVIEIENGKRAVGIKNVTINDQFFRGHFPTRPVMPGVLMVEAMAQTGGVVVLTNEAHRGKVAFFMAVDKVKFRKVVVPGDQLVMEVEVIKDKPRIAQIRAVSKVNDEIVAEADMVFSFTDASYLD
jgi:UDP-3-O-[3-hydroxymyristoyl] N-acetylglucosamine deacetylase / 3-hydroxyacyl-[acyl-carrier-protein] dehydratase